MREIQKTPEWQSAEAAGPRLRAEADGIDAVARVVGRSRQEAVQYVLGDCFFAVGQVIGLRMSVDYDAVVWWHDHFQRKFLSAMHHHGDRWLKDRQNVTAVGWMLAERAVRHAAGGSSIDVDAARRAAADVERYCRLHAKRAAQASDRYDEAGPRLAGYWCLPYPEGEDE